jgi:trans-aconitate 2-methyltransferase
MRVSYLDIERSGHARMWNPATYLQFADERARPFFDLLARVQAENPEFVVDLGCGPGNLTALLADRWPAAHVLGVDNSAAMIEAAQADSARHGPPDRAAGRLAFVQADIRDWFPSRPVDVFTCNAVLQWVPGHLELLTSWVSWLAPGGWLAFQLPGNFDQPSHTILRELAASPRWQPLLRDVQLNRQAAGPATYPDLLAAAGCCVDAWETTYLHVLSGPDAVVDWYKGSGLRPVLAALPPEQAAEFTAEYGDRIRAAYPPAAYGTVLPFRRIFVVARR